MGSVWGEHIRRPIEQRRRILAVIVGAIILIGVFALTTWALGADTALTSQTVGEAREAEPWSVVVSDDFDGVQDVGVATLDSKGSLFEFINPLSGEKTAELAVAPHASVTYRYSAEQLLVTDIPIGGDGVWTGRLLILDLHDLTVVGELPIPNRHASATFGQQIFLSNDERFAAYIEHRWMEDPAACRGASSCDTFTLHVVDLAGPSVAASTELPPNCNPGVNAAGPDGFLVRCADNTLTLYSGELREVRVVGFAEAIAELPTYDHPYLRAGHFSPGIVYGTVTTDGRIVAVTNDGFLLDDEDVHRVLPDGSWVSGVPQPLDADRIALPFAQERAGPLADGIAVLNTQTAMIEEVVRFENAAVPVVRNDDIFLLQGDGLLRVLRGGTAVFEVLGGVHSEAEGFVR